MCIASSGMISRCQGFALDQLVQPDLVPRRGPPGPAECGQELLRSAFPPPGHGNPHEPNALKQLVEELAACLGVFRRRKRVPFVREEVLHLRKGVWADFARVGAVFSWRGPFYFRMVPCILLRKAVGFSVRVQKGTNIMNLRPCPIQSMEGPPKSARLSHERRRCYLFHRLPRHSIWDWKIPHSSRTLRGGPGGSWPYGNCPNPRQAVGLDMAADMSALALLP